jgi:hypothetical protein
MKKETCICKLSSIHEYFNEIKLKTKNNFRGSKQLEKSSRYHSAFKKNKIS